MTMFIVGVRIDTAHTYANTDFNGAYYAASYEHAATAGNKGITGCIQKVFL